MATNRGVLGNLLLVGFRKILTNTWAEKPEQWTSCFNIETSTRAFEEDTGVVGFGMVPEKPEGSPILYDDPLRGYTKRYTHKTYGMGYQVTWEMVRDDQYRQMNRFPSLLARSYRHTLEELTIRELKDGFTGATGAIVGPDGQSLFSTAHPLVGGGTGANRPSTEGALSETTVEQMFIDVNNWTDDRGLKISLKPTTLLIPPSLRFDAQKLFNSALVPSLGGNTGATYAYGPNDINPLQGSLSIMVMDYLDDGGIGGTNPWFVKCDSHELTFFWRTRPVFDRDNDFETLNFKYMLYGSWSTGWSDWRGWYGNDGAA